MKDAFWAAIAVLGAPEIPPALAARLETLSPPEQIQTLAASSVFRRRVHDAILSNATLPHDALPPDTLNRALVWLGGAPTQDANGPDVLARLLQMPGFQAGLDAAGLDAAAFGEALTQRQEALGPDIIGALETGMLGECRGWAAQRDGRGGPLSLTILINDQAAASAKTGLLRQDVPARAPDTRQSGFHCLFDILQNLRDESRLTLRVIETTTGRQIGPRQTLAGAAGVAARPVRVPLILHDALMRAAKPLPPPEDAADGVSQILLGGADTDAIHRGGTGEPPVEIIPAADGLRPAVLQARHDTVIVQAAPLTWAPGALAWMVWAARQSGALIYCDEDRQSGTGDTATFSAPNWKPGFDYDLLLQASLPGAAIALPRDLALKAASDAAADLSGPAALYDLCLRVWEAHGDDGFRHLPLMLAHCTGGPEDGPAFDAAAHIAVTQAHLARRGLKADAAPARDSYSGAAQPDRLSITWRAPEPAAIRVIIPTRDRTDELKTCIDSLLATAAEPASLHITIIDNDSREAASRACLAALAGYTQVEVTADPRPFNWAAMNNSAAANAREPILLFANNDIECLTRNWDAILRGYLARPELGALGARLLYADDRLQHAGIMPGPGGGTVHDCEHDGVDFTLPRSALTRLDHGCLAVTGAFLACRRADFAPAGGFDEAFATTCNDLDFCLRLRAAGLTPLYTPALTLRHAGSLTRGAGAAAPEAGLEGKAALDRLMEKHGPDALKHRLDNPNFTGLPPRARVTPINAQAAMEAISPPRRADSSAPSDDRNRP